jgi:hypothetical protein
MILVRLMAQRRLSSAAAVPWTSQQGAHREAILIHGWSFPDRACAGIAPIG